MKLFLTIVFLYYHKRAPFQSKANCRNFSFSHFFYDWSLEKKVFQNERNPVSLKMYFLNIVLISRHVNGVLISRHVNGVLISRHVNGVLLALSFLLTWPSHFSWPGNKQYWCFSGNPEYNSWFRVVGS